MTELMAGDLRHRLVIEKRTNQVGERGQSFEQWEEIGRCWAKITPLYLSLIHISEPTRLNMDASYRLVNNGVVTYCVAFTSRGGDDLWDISIYTTRETS